MLSRHHGVHVSPRMLVGCLQWEEKLKNVRELFASLNNVNGLSAMGVCYCNGGKILNNNIRLSVRGGCGWVNPQ